MKEKNTTVLSKTAVDVISNQMYELPRISACVLQTLYYFLYMCKINHSWMGLKFI